MASLTNETDIIERVLEECVRRYATDDARMFTVFDRDGINLLVIEEGWQGTKRIYTPFVHVERREGNLSIQQDLTSHGIANDLVRAESLRNASFSPTKPRPCAKKSNLHRLENDNA